MEGGASAEESATPQVSVSGVTIEDAGTSIVTMQGSLQLSATIQPDTATYRGVIWESSDESIGNRQHRRFGNTRESGRAGYHYCEIGG